MPRIASRFGVNVAGALPFGESGAIRGSDGWAGRISGFHLQEPTSQQSGGKTRVWVLTFLVKLQVAAELIRTAAPVRPVVVEREVEKIGPRPGNTPLIRRA